jgi:hypothetical protein
MGSLIGNLEDIFQKTIHELKVGEEGWTSPENLMFDHEQNGYLELGGAIYKNFHDSASSLYIKRTGEEKNDFLVDTTQVKRYLWLKSNEPFGYSPESIKTDEDLNIAWIKYIPLEKIISDAEKREDYELLEKLKKENKI